MSDNSYSMLGVDGASVHFEKRFREVTTNLPVLERMVDCEL